MGEKGKALLWGAFGALIILFVVFRVSFLYELVSGTSYGKAPGAP